MNHRPKNNIAGISIIVKMKKIGSSARKEIVDMSGRKAFLDLRVKVNQNWRNKPDALRWLGYVRDKE